MGVPGGLDKAILAPVLIGGASKAKEAGVLIAGGHTVDDREPKYGLAVTGLVKAGQQVTNAGARVGDSLVLTKPIGTGIITTAGKFQRVDASILDNAIEVMRVLNRAPSEAMVKVGVNACTDVTGFGLLGHLSGMMEGSGVSAKITFGSVPQIDGAWDLLEQDIAPGGTHRNLDSLAEVVSWGPGVNDKMKLLLSDAQTSGGLLISVASLKRDELLDELASAGVETVAVIGEVVGRDSLSGSRIEVAA